LVGGMTLGTIFTLFIIPCLYMLMAKNTAKESRNPYDAPEAVPAKA
jgi:hypothetical protein